MKSSSIHVLAVCALMATHTLRAQSVVADAVAWSDLIAVAPSSAPDVVPRGTSLRGVSLLAGVAGSSPYASADFSLGVTGEAVTYAIHESGFSGPPGSGTTAVGVHETVWTLRSPVPVSGLLRVSVTGSYWGSFGSASSEIDVGNDGVVDFAYASTAYSWQDRVWERPLTISGALELRTITELLPLGWFDRVVTLTFRPEIRSLPRTACGVGGAPPTHPTLRVSSSTGGTEPGALLGFHLTPLMPASRSLLVIGFADARMPLPGCGVGGCNLVPSLDVVIAGASPMSSVAIPNGLSGLDVYAQGLELFEDRPGACSFAGLGLALSEAVRVTLR